MVIYFHQNFQDMLINVIRVDLVTQKMVSGHLKIGIFGMYPLSLVPYSQTVKSRIRSQQRRSLFSFPPKGVYDVVSFYQYFKLCPLQEVGFLAFTARQRARRLSPSPSLSQNIVVNSVYILYV